MSATETVVASLPIRAPSSIEVIDVDALDNDEATDPQFSGFHRRSSAGSGSRAAQGLAAEGLLYMGFRRAPTSGRSLVAESAQAGSSASGSRTMSEEVIVVESDDDEDGSLSSLNAERRLSRRIISPPPPIPVRGNTPAVPPLPRNLVTQASFPIRHRRRPIPPSLPPVIRPSDQPLPFETRMTFLPRLPPRSTIPIPAPRSHHQPSMGFGGAMLALNRQNGLEEANLSGAPRSSFNLPNFSDFLRRISSYGPGYGALDAPNTGPGHQRWRRFIPWMQDVAGVVGGDLPHFADEDDDLFDDPIPRKVAQKAVHWRPGYTHPAKAGPGFTFDFAPADIASAQSSGASSSVIVLDDDSAGSSSAASSSSSPATVETTLVCARCLDPFVLAAPEGAPEEVHKRCRVWALRCGHMLDGKCISQLIAPPLLPPELAEYLAESPAVDNFGKGKGKARADAEVCSGCVEPCAAEGTDTQSTDLPFPDRNSKRKAVDALEPVFPKRTALAEPAPEGNSIRSRLRSHARVAVEASPLSDLGSHSSSRPGPSRRRGRQGLTGASSDTSLLGPVQGQAQGRAKRKDKGRVRVARKPEIEAEHEWRCPITTCGRVHYGVRVEGEWKNDEGRGAIALFL